MHAQADRTEKSRWRAGLAVITAVLAPLLVAALLGILFLRVFAPEPRLAPLVPAELQKIEPMHVALSPEAVRGEAEKISSFGSRYLGQPGFYRTEEYIRQTYREAGLEVYEQENWTAAPRTIHSELTLAEGDEISTSGHNLALPKVYPFMPNHMQPMVTPPEGLVGQLTLVTTPTLETQKDFRDCIALIDCREKKIPENFGFDWIRYARLGFKAVIVAHPEGMAQIPWYRVAGGIVSSVPVNYVRLAATPEIFEFEGRRVRLRVKTEFANTRNTTVMGLLRSGTSDRERPAKDLLIVYAKYDACSILPDLAPGGLQVMGPATQLSLLKGLLLYKATLRRDVLFISEGAMVMAHDGLNNLLRVLDQNMAKAEANRLVAALSPSQGRREGQETGGNEQRQRPLRQRQQEHELRARQVRAIRELFGKAGFLEERAATQAALNRLDAGTRQLFDEQLQYVINSVAFELNESLVKCKVALERNADQATGGAAFVAYQNARKASEEVATAVGTTAGSLLERRRDLIERHGLKNRLAERMVELEAYHQQRLRQLSQDMALVRLFEPYENTVVVEPRILPAYDPGQAREALSFAPGTVVLEAQANTFKGLLNVAKERLKIGRELEIPELARWQEYKSYNETWDSSTWSARMWANAGFPAYVLMNFSRSESYYRFGYPVDQPPMTNMESIRNSLAVTGLAVLMLAHGNGVFPPTPVNVGERRSFGGRVLAAGVGQAVVPNYPLRNALVATRGRYDTASYARRGYYDHLMVLTDPYGRFDLPNNASDFPNWWRSYDEGFTFTPVATAYGPDGLIDWMKDEGEEGQRLYKATRMSMNDYAGIANATIVAFRAAPTAILDLTNPQTMKDYTGIRLVRSDGLDEFRKICLFRDASITAAYIEPDRHFYALLEAGTPDNEYAQVTRAFMLGTTRRDGAPDGAAGAWRPDARKTIDGPGFLVADNPYLLDVPVRVARSMADVNGKRLRLQNRYAMADERTNDYHGKAVSLLAASEQPDRSKKAAYARARESVTYSTLNHPVLRESITESVLGIIWYLGLLVPFVFFFEKLAFGFTDIRKQLTAQAVIFMAVFILLRLLHPAFQMVRSSLMILLSFVIMLISGGTMLLFSGKFQENIEELRRRRGKVKAAEVNVMAAVGSAFLLGLNNMHRRRVRTGLTCATLVLLTFVMICFTSLQSDLVDKTEALGKALYQGMVIKWEKFNPISGGEIGAVRNKYGDRYDVCERLMICGTENWVEQQRYNPKLTVAYTKDVRVREARLNSAMQFSWKEPLRERIKFLTHNGWFTEQECVESESTIPIMIPDTLARGLGISPQEVDAIWPGGGVRLQVNGRPYAVKGIFEAEAFNNLRDLDGLDLLPFDIENMKVAQKKIGDNNVILAESDDPRVPADRLILTPLRDLRIRIEDGFWRCASLAVAMPKASYKEVRETITAYMEQTTKPVFFGLDGIAYVGERARRTSLVGLLDLLIPLIIAALTVLNTMKGSVYERREEIYVYNAVGIAPRNIFAMFFAEAFVYAVVGSVLGYVLSQGIGRILVVLNLTGGLNMTFTSVSTIYASLAIGAAVFTSTWFPARSAMEIAKPAEEAGWRLPEPEGDRLTFDLPFAFSRRDRIAVLAFFRRYLEDHGEGGSGRFFSGPPQVSLGEPLDDPTQGAYTPGIRSIIWLKPFDLGVSQRMQILLPTDAETGEFKAQIILARLSGTQKAWLRLNRSFVAIIRRHFLHWRAVSEPERVRMFDEARDALLRNLQQPAASPQEDILAEELGV